MPIINHAVHGPDGQPAAPALMMVGPVIPIEIHVPPVIAQALADAGQPIPAPVAGLAIVDTGATMTCIDEPILKGLGLNPVDVVWSGTANGPAQQSVYPARIFFPTTGLMLDLPGAAGVDLRGQMIPVTPPQPPIALLGRNFLANTILVYNGPAGHWSLAH